ncbi:hypothetical protein BC826DRAFT_323274 [Russula brevipes]|nr:hypothetical protein BC826DRAFT_323274 [Russula brevipes]
MWLSGLLSSPIPDITNHGFIRLHYRIISHSIFATYSISSAPTLQVCRQRYSSGSLSPPITSFRHRIANHGFMRFALSQYYHPPPPLPRTVSISRVCPTSKFAVNGIPVHSKTLGKIPCP